MRLSLILFVLIGPCCSYRFSNLYVTKPEGINSIAIESVYDTSREVIPHELMWEALQRAFARNGHIRVVSQGSADALLRAHIRSASVKATGSKVDLEPKNDPKLFQGGDPPGLGSFKNLSRAGRYSVDDALDFVVEIEVWDLTSGKIVFKSTYSGGETFKAIRANDVETTTPSNYYLRYEEALATKFRKVSDGIAENVVKDMLTR